MRKLLTVLVVALLVVAACSSDDEEAPPEATGTIKVNPTIPVLEPDEIDRTASPYCDTWADLRSQDAPDVSDLDDETAAARRRAHYSALRPLVERLLSQSDDEIRGAVEVARTATGEAATTGSFEPFRTPEAKASTKQLAEYAHANCRRR